jgi:hypothetical protein
MANRNVGARRLAGRPVAITVLLCVAILSLGLVLLSPLALNLFPPDRKADWERLSYIGQTYGAASAILSMLALGGVALSLLLQGRETKATREQALRGLHVDLIKIALDDPLYLSCWGPFSGSTNIDDRRRHMYTNLMVSHWQMMWEVGGLHEKHLRVLAQELFAGETGRRFWSLMGDVRLDVELGRKTRRFHSIMADEYTHAVRNGPPVKSQDDPLPPPMQTSPPDADRTRAATVAASVGLGVLLGACVTLVLRGKRRR